MAMRPASRAALGVAIVTLAALVTACWDDDAASGGPPEPMPAWVGIDYTVPKVESAWIDLTGEAECPGCTASQWQYGSCPVIACPSGADLGMGWANHSTGATGTPTHGVFPTCHCPWPWGYGYCYSACNHGWWTTIALTYGDNDIEVTATAPGYAPGSASVLIQRAPLAPQWTGVTAGVGQVTLAWGPVEGATSYNLYWMTEPYGWAHLGTQIAGVTSPYTHTGLTAGTPYYYFVLGAVDSVESYEGVRASATPQ